MARCWRSVSIVCTIVLAAVSDAFLKSLKDQAGKPLVFAKDVITKPGETLSGIPKGVGRLFSNATTAITNTKDPSQESTAKELLLVGACPPTPRDAARRSGEPTRSACSASSMNW